MKQGDERIKRSIEKSKRPQCCSAAGVIMLLCSASVCAQDVDTRPIDFKKERQAKLRQPTLQTERTRIDTL